MNNTLELAALGPVIPVIVIQRLQDAVPLAQALVDDVTWAARERVLQEHEQADLHAHDLGRELFAGMRRNVSSAEEGAISWL